MEFPNVLFHLFVWFDISFFLFKQRKVNSTAKCVSIVMQRSTVELVCRITSGHMQNENEMPYLKEPVSFTYNAQIKKPP